MGGRIQSRLKATTGGGDINVPPAKRNAEA